MQLGLYGETHSAQQQPFNVGDLVHERGADHNIPARVVLVINYHEYPFVEIHFKYKSILKKQILPTYRLQKYEYPKKEN
jgi:hypothetical protein